MLQTIQWKKLPPSQRVSDLIVTDGGVSMTLADLHSKMNTQRDGLNRFEWANARSAIQYLRHEYGNKFDIKTISVGHVLKVCDTLVKTRRSPETAKKVKQGVAWLVRFANGVDKEKHMGGLTVTPFKGKENDELKTFRIVKIDKRDVEHLWSQKKPTIYADFTNMVVRQIKRTQAEEFGIQGLQGETPTKSKARLTALHKAIRPHNWWARWNPVENMYLLRKGMEPKKRGPRA